MLIECSSLSSYRAKCSIGPFLEAMRLVRPGISAWKLYSLFLADSELAKIRQRALGLYYMLKAWHDELGITMKF